MTRSNDLTDPNIVKALAHPLRVRILSILDQRRATPRQIAEELDDSLPLVSYHVRQLAKLGLLELVETRQVRGTVEHHYRAVPRAGVTNDTWALLPEIVKQKLVGTSLSQLGQAATTSAAAGGFSRPQANMARTALVLDDKGLEAVSAELLKLLDRVDKIQDASKKRLQKSGHEGEIRMTLALLFFDQVEVPAEEAQPSGTRKRRTTRAVGAGRHKH